MIWPRLISQYQEKSAAAETAAWVMLSGAMVAPTSGYLLSSLGKRCVCLTTISSYSLGIGGRLRSAGVDELIELIVHMSDVEIRQDWMEVFRDAL